MDACTHPHLPINAQGPCCPCGRDPRLTPDILAAMRAWAADCDWLDAEALDAYTDAQILRGVRRHYAGGLEQFLADA